VLGWTLLAHASTAQFTADLVWPITRWLDAHAWAGFILGFALLVVAVSWSEITPYLPRLPKTIEQRVHAIEKNDLPALEEKIVKAITNYIDIQSGANKLFTDQASQANEHITEHITQIGKIECGLMEIDGKFERLSSVAEKAAGEATSALSRLDEHRPWIHDLEVNIGRLNYAIGNIESFAAFQLDITALITEARAAIDGLKRIDDYYPSSDAALFPFSKMWWKADITPTPPQPAIEWSLIVKRHMDRCCEFAAAYHMAQSDLIEANLQGVCASWSSQKSRIDSMGYLASQEALLKAVRQDHAIRFSARVLSAKAS
jgi:hypothetical protein